MPRITRIPPDAHRHMPWRNGGGTTAEILAEPGPGGRFRFRLSIAEVDASGPFSDFGGYERHILLLEGEGFALRLDGEAPHRIDRPLVPFTFDGGRRVACTLLGGPVRDLNLIVDRETARGVLRAHHLASGERVRLPLDGTVVVHVVHGSLDAAGTSLGPGDTLRADGEPGEEIALAAREPAAAVVASIRPADAAQGAR